MKKVIMILLTIILLSNIFFLLFFKLKRTPPIELKNFTAEELIKYNGTDENLPIYMSYNGDVYDVTQGRDFYRVGGAYHDLAGRDSTKELNIAGGGIIKIKYRIIGKLR